MHQKPGHLLEIGLAGKISLWPASVIRAQAEAELIGCAQLSCLQLVFHNLIPGLKAEILMNNQLQTGLCGFCCDLSGFGQCPAEGFLADNNFCLRTKGGSDRVCLLVRRQNNIQNIRLCCGQHLCC